MANGHGGARKNAGRKTTAQKFKGPINKAEKIFAASLEEMAQGMLSLAAGGHDVVEEYFEPAGTITVDDTDILHNDNGDLRSVRIKRLAFPDNKPDDMILVKRVVKTAAPDFRAVAFALERIMGKAVQGLEVNDEDGEAVPFAIVRLPSKLSVEQWQKEAAAAQKQVSNENSSDSSNSSNSSNASES